MSLLPFLSPEKERCHNASTSQRSPVVVNKVFSEVNFAIHGKGKKREYQKLSPEEKGTIGYSKWIKPIYNGYSKWIKPIACLPHTVKHFTMASLPNLFINVIST